MINMRSSSTSPIPSVQGATVACTCLPINSIGRVREYIGNTMDRNTTYKSGTTPSAYTLSTLAQYYRHPEQPVVFSQTAVCTDNPGWNGSRKPAI